VLGSCASCHNNASATGKPDGHINTSQDCSACHNATAWLPAKFDHAGITGNCVSCHNGSDATGKSALHMPTTTRCESCHSLAG
jgi:predicted CXXCH cytochrome family protein